eukprot:gene8309-1580_t
MGRLSTGTPWGSTAKRMDPHGADTGTLGQQNKAKSGTPMGRYPMGSRD